MKLQFYGTINGDKIRADWRTIFRQVCKKFTGGIVMTFEPMKDKRTLNQLRYFHGPLLKSVQEYYQEREGMTYTFDRLKYMLKEKYIGVELLDWDDETPMLLPRMDVNGKMIMVREVKMQSLSDITFEEMKEFISMIVQDFWTVRGWAIPEPEETVGSTGLKVDAGD